MAFFASLLVLGLVAVPARAQLIVGNPAGGPGNAVIDANGFLRVNTNFYASYLTGTAYTLTSSIAAVTGGTTSPTLTLGAAGT